MAQYDRKDWASKENEDSWAAYLKNGHIETKFITKYRDF